MGGDARAGVRAGAGAAAALAVLLVGAAAPAGAQQVGAREEAPSGPVLAFAGHDGADGEPGLFGLDTGTGRQWRIAEGSAHDVHFSPDGTRIAWIGHGDDDLGSVQVAAADGSGRQRLDAPGDSRSLTWAPDGALSWFHRSAWSPTDCTDPDRLTRVELVHRTADGAQRALGTAAATAAQLRASPDGRTLAWVESGPDVCAAAPTQLVVADVATGAQVVVAGAEDAADASFSPDSARLALTHRDGDVVLVDVAAGTAHRVRTDGVLERRARFTGTAELVLARTTGTSRQLSLVGLDGGVHRDLGTAPEFVDDLVVAPDGALVVAGRSAGAGAGSLLRHPLDGAPATLLGEDARAVEPELAVAPWSSPAPVLERRARSPR
ncbi:TolB family protein [Kineococcus sp. SYSU DK006]|uniref:TolB family protein n=1 Tax=Kineococcus sp. SYSU DK006 TaxID=3383127 RepID=UPI003D7CD1BF